MTAVKSRHRLSLTLRQAEYERLTIYARHAGRPLATVAKRLLLGAIDDDRAATNLFALDRERQRVHQLEARLQAELAANQASTGPTAQQPRWRWPLTSLLADRAWWDEWLPLLGELLGRYPEAEVQFNVRDPRPAVDDRGFADLMKHLFPDLTDEHGAAVPWHSPDYGRRSRLAWRAGQPGRLLRERPVRAEVWEPVVRQVALALTALETTSQTAGDAYTHLRVQAEIRGEWLRTLGAMLGADVSHPLAHLPRGQSW